MVEQSIRPISIFVSYSHEDARHRPYLSSSRMGELLADIKYDLGAQSERSNYRFIKDDEGLLRVGDRIDEKITMEIARADIGLVFLSEHYCNSESCKKELLDMVASDKKLVLVELDETWTNSDAHKMVAIRTEVKEVLTSRFWQGNDGTVLRIGHPLPSTANRVEHSDYLQQVAKLVRDIKEISQELVEKSDWVEELIEDVDSALVRRVQIVLASSTSDTKTETDRLERAFRAAGYGVIRLDHATSALTAPSIRESIVRGDLFVQVVGAIPGRGIEDYHNLPSSVAQYRIAEEENIEIAAWLKTGFDVEECGEEYAKSLKSMFTQTNSLEDLESFCLRFAKKRQSELDSEARVVEKKGAHTLANPPLVSIDAAGTDIGLRDRIMQALGKHVHVDCIDADASMEALSDAVQDNDAILLVYGEQVEGQKRAKAHFRFFRRWRSEVLNDDQQKFEIAFGDAAPKSASPCPVGPGIHVIRIGDDIDSTSMDAFLAALGVETDEPIL